MSEGSQPEEVVAGNEIRQEVELIIRSAYQSAEDITFSCPKDWTILKIKQHVHNVSSSHPPVTSQRLIFSGTSLDDTMVLENIIKERSVVDGAQVFHLVCTQPFASQEIRQRSNATSSSPTSPPNSSAQSTQNMDWNMWWANYNQQSAAYQAQYSQYYYNWMQYYHAQNYQGGMVNGITPGFSQTPQNQQNQQNHTVAQNAQNMMNGMRIAFNGAPNVNGAPVVAPAAPVAPPQPGERVDILEIFYRLFKLVLFFSAVLLYSSFERFALVLSAALFIYFIQLRRNHARNRAAAQAREPSQQTDEQNQQVNNNNAGESENENESVPLQEIPSGPSGMQVFFATCYSFVTSFFASLVPDHPMPVDIN